MSEILTEEEFNTVCQSAHLSPDAFITAFKTVIASHRALARRVGELEAENRTLRTSEKLVGIVADPSNDSYIDERSQIIHDEEEWFNSESKEAVYDHYVCALLNWSFSQDRVTDLHVQLAAQAQTVGRLREALEKYADRENWGYYDESGCPKGYGRYTSACFIGPEVAQQALGGGGRG